MILLIPVGERQRGNRCLLFEKEGGGVYSVAGRIFCILLSGKRWFPMLTMGFPQQNWSHSRR
jgi:hypothetical protein